MTRGQRGRAIAREELALAAILAFVVGPFLFIAAPGSMGPSPRFQELSLAVGVLGLVVGFAWMIRIYRGDPEPDQRSWRYRAWD